MTKLGDIKGARAFDVIADCIGPISNLAKDKEVAALMKTGDKPEGMSSGEYMLQSLSEHLPQVLKAHKKDIIAIMAAIEGVSPQKYAQDLTLSKLMSDFYSLMTDEDLLSLFTSAPGTTVEPE